MLLIDVRCTECRKLLCRVSKDFYGIVEVWCRHCKFNNAISLATILTQLRDDHVKIIPTRAPAQ